jgi:hypothetical protein
MEAAGRVEQTVDARGVEHRKPFRHRRFLALR